MSNKQEEYNHKADPNLDKKIQDIITLTNVANETAISILKQSNGDVQLSVNKIFSVQSRSNISQNVGSR